MISPAAVVRIWKVSAASVVDLIPASCAVFVTSI